MIQFYRSIVLSFYRSIVYRSIVLSFYRSIVLSFYRSNFYLLLPQLNNLFKSSNMRFAAKRTFSRFALKAELILHRLFNWGRLDNLHSRNKYAGNRGEVTPSGCELILHRLFNWARLDNLHSRNKYARNRGEKSLFGCELTLSQSFKHGSLHNLYSSNNRARNRGEVTPLGCNKCASIFKRLTQRLRHAFCTPFACKAELTLSQSFKHGRLHNLQSSNIYARNRGEKSLFGVTIVQGIAAK